jgi:hypothetical protein
MRLMTRHVPTEFGFNDLHGSLGKATLLFVGRKGMFHTHFFQQTTDRFILKLATSVCFQMPRYQVSIQHRRQDTYHFNSFGRFQRNDPYIFREGVHH